MRLNVSIDDEHAEILLRLAERTHLQPGTIARSMLMTMLERSAESPERSSDADLLRLLDGIDGAFDRVSRGRRQAAAGAIVSLDEV